MITSKDELSEEAKLESLERLRKKLLDFSLRNRFLNFRDTGAKVVNIIDELPEQVFEHLVVKNKPMTLDPLNRYCQ